VDNILGPEHGTLNPNFTLNEQQIKAIVPLLTRMRFFQALRLQPGDYGDLLMTGAKFEAMVRRARRAFELLNRTGKNKTTFERIVGLWGQRPRTDASDGSVQDIYSRLSLTVRTRAWVLRQMDLMMEPNALDEWHGAFATEFELGILAMLVAADGNMTVSNDNFEENTDTTTLPGIPVRSHLSCTLRLPDGTTMVALNAPAVERPKGPPRPTSISSTMHWLDFYPPRPTGRVVSMPVRVHGRRVSRDLREVINARSPGIEVFGFSEEVEGDVMPLFNNALGEAVAELSKAREEHAELLVS